MTKSEQQLQSQLSHNISCVDSFRSLSIEIWKTNAPNERRLCDAFTPYIMQIYCDFATKQLSHAILPSSFHYHFIQFIFFLLHIFSCWLFVFMIRFYSDYRTMFNIPAKSKQRFCVSQVFNLINGKHTKSRFENGKEEYQNGIK